MQHDRLPLQRNGRNFRVAVALLPKAVARRLKRGDAAAPTRNKWQQSELRRGPRGRETLHMGDVVVGRERQPKVSAEHIRAGGIYATKGNRRHLDANFDRALAMVAPFHPAHLSQQGVLAVSGRRAGRGQAPVSIPMIRMSSRTRDTRTAAGQRCPDGIHEFVSGQGGGVFALAATLHVATLARSEGRRVVLEVCGDFDRFLRTGTHLARLVLRRAGIYLRSHRGARCEDHVRVDELQRRRAAGAGQARRLRGRLRRYLGELFLAAETGDATPGLPDLSDLTKVLHGIPETLACGAGLDWLRRDEAAADGIGSEHQVQRLATLPSFVPFAGQGGYWHVEPGYRHRRRPGELSWVERFASGVALEGHRTLPGLKTVLRPVVVRGHEVACMRLFRARWPHATFRKPVVLDWAWSSRVDGAYLPDAAACQANVTRIAAVRGEAIACVDHASLHYGSVFDLDVLVRQQGCSLHAVLPGSYLHPEITRELLDEVAAIRSDARRFASAIDDVAGSLPDTAWGGDEIAGAEQPTPPDSLDEDEAVTPRMTDAAGTAFSCSRRMGGVADEPARSRSSHPVRLARLVEWLEMLPAGSDLAVKLR